jgi:hypothetical protein
MSDMATWASSVIIPIGVSIVTVVVTNLTIGPWLAARGRRIQAANDAYDNFSDSVLDLLALCANLQRLTIPMVGEGPLRPPLQAERDRWEAQIGEITTWLGDHWQRYTAGYRTPQQRETIPRTVAVMRLIWTTENPLEERLRTLEMFTSATYTAWVKPSWRKWRPVAKPREVHRLSGLLDAFEEDAPLKGASRDS